MSAVLPSEIILAEPRGFCAGVDRAIDIVEHALSKFGAPIYVRHEIVHNTHVVNDLRSRGAIFIEDLNDVPPGATLVFSAHGVPKAVEHEAQRRGFRVFDATCPLVTKGQVASNTRNPRRSASCSTALGTPCALNTKVAPGGTSFKSSMKMAPRERRSLTTWVLCTISWRT